MMDLKLLFAFESCLMDFCLKVLHYSISKVSYHRIKNKSSKKFHKVLPIKN